ncbi:MAG: hypothetical protein QM669_02115 [Siphonobacter sp.]
MKKLLFLLPILFVALSSFVTNNDTKGSIPRKLPKYDTNLDLHFDVSSCKCNDGATSCSIKCETGGCSCNCGTLSCLCICTTGQVTLIKKKTDLNSEPIPYKAAQVSVSKEQYQKFIELSNILTSFNSKAGNNSQELLVQMIELLKQKKYDEYHLKKEDFLSTLHNLDTAEQRAKTQNWFTANNYTFIV